MLVKIGMIALGGSMGAVARFLLSTWIHQKTGMGFPLGTLAANVVGCLFIGFLVSLPSERFHVDTGLHGMLIIGFLGAFTTFSTFTHETWKLFASGAVMHGGLNILVSLIACFLGIALGVYLAKLLTTTLGS